MLISSAFESDIKGKNTQFYPLVLIEYGDLADYIFLSTNNVTVDGDYYKPILLNIPSIKESVDVESRKFKISNVSLDISNIEYQGERFTDILSESSLINTTVSIFIKSPSTTTVSISAFDTNPTNGCPRIYTGIIRRISHDDTKVKIELEDLTEKLAHKNLPDDIEGYTSIELPEKYRNKVIPMVYGEVSRSPVVVSEISDEGNGDFIFSIDEKEIGGIYESPLYPADKFNDTGFLIYDGDYASVNKKSGENVNSFSLPQASQWEHSTGDNQIKLLRDYRQDSEGSLIDVDMIELTHFVNTKRVKTYFSASDAASGFKLYDIYEDFENVSALLNEDLTDALEIDSQHMMRWGLLNGNGSSAPIGTEFRGMFFLKFELDNTFSMDANYLESNLATNFFYNKIVAEFETTSTNFLVKTGGGESYYLFSESGSPSNNLDSLLGSSFVQSMQNTSAITGGYATNSIQTTTDMIEDIHNNEATPPTIYIALLSDESNPQTGSHRYVSVSGLGVLVYGEYKKPFSKKFYANVKGRINIFTDHPEPTFAVDDITTDGNEASLIENPIDIIYDLVRSELGHDAIDEDEYTEAKLAHDGWKFGFTVNKKISSKKLIEDIAKSTKCFPKFKNDGTFGFNTIKDSYDVDNDYAGATLIKESDVISYSFKKTKPEQIYKKVTVSYNKDYAQDSYLKTALSTDLGDDPYYGIEDSSDAHLEFESDYIRYDSSNGAEQTADKLASFLSEQYKNDHLLFNLKLPLQYINLEIGDLVKFRDLFVKAYGIDYRVIQSPNIDSEQTYYPLFMVTSTTKNLDSVSIECMQLHNLDVSGFDANWNTLPVSSNQGYSYSVPTLNIPADAAVSTGELYSGFSVSATDSDGNNLEVTNTRQGDFIGWTPAGSVYDTVGIFSITYRATDSNGNQAIGVQKITISQALVPEGDILETRFLEIEHDAGNDLQLISAIGDPEPYIGGGGEHSLPIINFLDYNTIFIKDAFIRINRVGDEDTTFDFIITDIISVTNDDLTVTSGEIRMRMIAHPPNLDFDYLQYYDDTDLKIQATLPSASSLGDVNFDGAINILDIVRLVNHIFGLNPLPEEYQGLADVNGDGMVNILDVVSLINDILEL